MKKRCTRVLSLEIKKLKGITNLGEINLDHNITGIFGPNGVGKSTILQALAAAFQPPRNACGHDFQTFFPKLKDDVWDGSHFKLGFKYKQGQLATGETTETYREGTVATYWTPTKTKRPIHSVHFIGVRSVVPAIERHNNHKLVDYTVDEETLPHRISAMNAAGEILNISYEKLFRITPLSHISREYFSIKRPDTGDTPLMNVVLGAGEQRLLDILQTIHGAQKGSLILIDEIDVLLHGEALIKFFKHLRRHCQRNFKQIVFTSHREKILTLQDFVHIIHIHRAATGHISLPRTDPDAIARLTGERKRRIEVFVEDVLAQAVTNHVIQELGMSRQVAVQKFGAAKNAYTLAAGLLLAGQDCTSSIFLLDGDVDRTQEEKKNQCQSACCGNDVQAVRIRGQMLTSLSQFNLPADTKPDAFINSLIASLDSETLSPGEAEIQRLAAEIQNPIDSHDFVRAISNALANEESAALLRITQLASKAADWEHYTAPLREFLNTEGL